MPSRSDLTGKVALVTGGGRGIGKAIAERLVEAGANVAIASRKMENLETAAEEFKKYPGRTLPVACHVGKNEQIEAAVAKVEAELGVIDILVNNSATNVFQGSALDVTDAAVMKMVEINCLSAIRTVRITVPKMIEKGWGRVINISSIAGLRPQTDGLMYSFTKSALIMMTRSWAHEFGPKGVNVNAIAPGLIKTDFSSALWQDEGIMDRVNNQQPIRRIGTVDEVGGLGLFLGSDESSYITGQTFVVDGGATAR